MKLFCSRLCLWMCIALIGLVSCQEKSSVSVQQQNSASVKPVKEAKPGAAIKLASSSIVFLNANDLTSVDLLLDANATKGILHFELSATNGLEILDTKIQGDLELAPAVPVKIPVKLRAIDGRYYLNIQASIDNGDSVSSRSLAVIVQVGAEQEKNAQFKKSAGENVIPLPARETISN